MAASQVVSSTADLEVLEIVSYIRGYHAYKDVWTPVLGECLLVKHEPTNIKDSNAVAVCLETTIVGHAPFNLSASLSHYLRWEVNKAFAEVTGTALNRGGGYGMEVPCKYRLYGPKPYIQKMKQIVDSITASGHL